MADGATSVAADGNQNMAQAAYVADGAASAEVAADADPAENQDPEADGGPDDNVPRGTADVSRTVGPTK